MSDSKYLFIFGPSNGKWLKANGFEYIEYVPSLGLDRIAFDRPNSEPVLEQELVKTVKYKLRCWDVKGVAGTKVSFFIYVPFDEKLTDGDICNSGNLTEADVFNELLNNYRPGDKS